MATKTFTQLTAVTTLAAADEMVMWNNSAGAARKITITNFFANVTVPVVVAATGTQMTLGTAGSSSTRAALNLLADSPRVFWSTTSGKANWKAAAQDGIDGGWEIAKGGTDTDGSDDTYTTYFYVGDSGEIALQDGVTAPSTAAGYALIYVDTADGDLKVKFGDGHVATIAADS